jgi:hypothetical protein
MYKTNSPFIDYTMIKEPAIRKWFVDESRAMLNLIIQEQLTNKTPDDLISERFVDCVCDAFRIAPGHVRNELYFITLARTYLPIFEEGSIRSELHTDQYVFQHMVRNWYITMRGKIGPESFIRTYLQKPYLTLEGSPPYFATGMPDTFISDFSRLPVPNSGYRYIFNSFCRDCDTACSLMRNRIEPCVAIQDQLRAAKEFEARLNNALNEDTADLVKSFLKDRK